MDAHVGALARAARPLDGGDGDFDVLVEACKDVRFVLIGESTHGTHDFYAHRARITQRLIEELGFTAVAAEADWPDAYRLNCWVRGAGDDPDADAALSGFRRFPVWMWRNHVVRGFAQWLQRRNSITFAPTGFYGLDLYSLHASMHEVVRVLEKRDPDAAERARRRYECFDHFGAEAEAYAWKSGAGADDCEAEVVAQLVEMLGRDTSGEDEFYAAQNARLIRNAEAYYRTLYRGAASTWNLRDRHMADTLEALAGHLNGSSRIVVWAHNSHVGDARAWEMGDAGELSLGQLVRERHPGDCLLVGMTTSSGTVTAARAWGERGQQMFVRPPLPESYEAMLHQTGVPAFVADLRTLERPLPRGRLERAIGVVYRPDTERVSHYLRSDLSRRFDVVVHLNETSALRTLDDELLFELRQMPADGSHAAQRR